MKKNTVLQLVFAGLIIVNQLTQTSHCKLPDLTEFHSPGTMLTIDKTASFGKWDPEQNPNGYGTKYPLYESIREELIRCLHESAEPFSEENPYNMRLFSLFNLIWILEVTTKPDSPDSTNYLAIRSSELRETPRSDLCKTPIKKLNRFIDATKEQKNLNPEETRFTVADCYAEIILKLFDNLAFDSYDSESTTAAKNNDTPPTTIGDIRCKLALLSAIIGFLNLGFLQAKVDAGRYMGLSSEIRYNVLHRLRYLAYYFGLLEVRIQKGRAILCDSGKLKKLTLSENQKEINETCRSIYDDIKTIATDEELRGGLDESVDTISSLEEEKKQTPSIDFLMKNIKSTKQALENLSQYLKTAEKVKEKVKKTTDQGVVTGLT